MKTSGFVVSYNREAIIKTCLESIRWVDELIVIDKSSTDSSPDIARRIADKVVTVPWSPTVEETRALALSLVTHDFIVFLDDDECFSAEAIAFLKGQAQAPSADLFRIFCRHYILGVHDERAYYWPQLHVRAFIRGAMTFTGTVHGAWTLKSDKILDAPANANICFHNFSHADVATFIEKTNRYTGCADRVKSIDSIPDDLGRYAQETMNVWLNKKPKGDHYTDSVAILRAIYDIVDTLKMVEDSRGISGHAMFKAELEKLRASHEAALRPAILNTPFKPHRVTSQP